MKAMIPAVGMFLLFGITVVVVTRQAREAKQTLPQSLGELTAARLIEVRDAGGQTVLTGSLTFTSERDGDVEGGRAIRLPFNGAGIRSIEYDGRVKNFRVITGSGPNSERLNFKLWEWDGNGEQPALRELGTYDRRLKPEGFTRASAGGRDFGFIVFDTSGYAAAE